jgi:addiction module RelE/StbE family toxin
MSFQLAQVDSFSNQLALAPKPVRNAMKRVIPELRSEPDKVKLPKIKRLTGYKGLWRYRVNNSYRLVYRVEKASKENTVTLLLLGDRKDVYERLGQAEDGTPGIRVIASGVEDLLEVEPTPQQFGDAILGMALEEAGDPDPEAPLPVPLTSELLTEWGVPGCHHGELIKASTEDQLLGAKVPGEVVERVMNGLWPPTIERTLQEPIRVVPDEVSLLAAAEPTEDLVHLLLKLDAEQKAFVSRFERPTPEGPWLLKGGPGSGKSVVALYCIKALLDQEAAKLPGQQKPLRILLTTYTNSLVNASRELSRRLDETDIDHKIDVRTVDKVATAVAGPSGVALKSGSDKVVRDAANEALQQCNREHKSFSFQKKDLRYLLDEFEWVIVGQDLESVEEYVDRADRTGRRRALGRVQRQHVWSLYEKFTAELEKQGLALWIDRQRDALKKAKPKYDYVFIDEAQDLKPVGVRFLLKLAQRPQNVFLTADSNQSIYGTGMSWARVAEDLQVHGRAQILRKNYRTTKEIWHAVSQLSPAAEDRETSAIEPVYSGPSPLLVMYNDLDEWSGRLNRFIFDALREERLGPDSAAVLVSRNNEAAAVVARISPKFRPKAFTSKTLDIAYPGLKVLTMHAAKGLEFPVVVIAAANDDRLPGSPFFGTDPDDHLSRQHRLLFVGATRAMRQLMVLAQADNPSRFLSGATDDHWEIENL